MFCKIFIYVHKNLFAPQTWDLLEKLALIFLYNFHREHGLINLIRKKLSPEIIVKNIIHRVFLELLSIAHTMHDLQFSCHTNRNNRAGRWRCVHSKAVCTICAIGPIFAGAEPPLYIPRNSNTVWLYNPWFTLSFVIFDACCDGKIKL